MAEKDPKEVIEARKKIAEIASTLTSEGKPIFTYDNETYYSKGETFQELDGIRDIKLPGIMRKVVKNEAAKKEATDGLKEAEVATLKQAQKLLKKAEDSLKANDGKANLDVPMARIVVAADGYRDAGKNEEAGKLYDYAIQQAEIIEKETLAANAKEPEEKKRTPTMTDALKAYKAAIDTAAGKKMEAELKGGPVEKKDGQPMSSASKPDFAAMLASAENVQLDRNVLTLAKPPVSKVRGAA